MKSPPGMPIVFGIVLSLFLVACSSNAPSAVSPTPTPTQAHYTATATDPAGTTQGTSWHFTFVFDHPRSTITTWMYDFPKGFSCYTPSSYYQVLEQSVTNTLTTPTPVVNGLLTLSDTTSLSDTLTIKGTLSAASTQAAGTWSLVGPPDQGSNDDCSGSWVGSSG